MLAERTLRLSTGAALVVSLLLLSSCAVPLGPGYTIEKQTLDVHFVAQPQPHLEIRAWYRMMNTGNEPLSSIEVFLPAQKSYMLESLRAELDGHEISAHTTDDSGSDKVPVVFQPPWFQKQRHELTVSYVMYQVRVGEGSAVFVTEDAFSLPSGKWYPEPRPPKGTFSQGTSPPKKWDLIIQIPDEFLVHASGSERKKERRNGETAHRFEEHAGDYFPFVISGRYQQKEIRAENQVIYFWTHTPFSADEARQEGEAIAKTISFYDSAFGPRTKQKQPVWIVVCSIPDPAIRNLKLDDLLFVDKNVASDLPGVANACPGYFVDSVTGKPLRVSELAKANLVSAWFGYGLDPDWEKRDLPLDALPQYAHYADQSQSTRANSIGENLKYYDSEMANGKGNSLEGSKDKKAPAEPYLARYRKGVSFFFALEDQYGRDHLHHAIARMIHARLGRGYDLDDLRSALEAETGQSVAEFFHHWLDKPGIPEDFRLRYAQPNPSTTDKPMEEQP